MNDTKLPLSITTIIVTYMNNRKPKENPQPTIGNNTYYIIKVENGNQNLEVDR